jgi:SAM-dependent methyltransferase
MSIQAAGPENRNAEPLAEDMLALAEYEFRIARSLCGECREYHALYTYTRLAGVNKSVITDGDVATAALRKAAPRNARILIAGAADAGLLSLTARATLTLDPAITVVDRCPTPLAVCRRFADQHAFSVTTLEANLTREAVPGSFDVAFAHNILLFIPEDRRVDFFANLGRSLGSGGSLVLINRIRHPERKEDGSVRFGKFADEIEKGLAEREIPLPEPDADFRRRLEAAAAVEYKRSGVSLTLPQIEASLAGAGFQIDERIEHYRRRSTMARDDNDKIPVPNYVITASYRG